MRRTHDYAHECLKEVTGASIVNFRESSSSLVRVGDEVVGEGRDKIEPEYPGCDAKARFTLFESICGYSTTIPFILTYFDLDWGAPISSWVSEVSRTCWV
jgi:hypothetical protein